MARDFVSVIGAHADDVGVLLESSGGLLFQGMNQDSGVAMGGLCKFLVES